ncbi:hypothetical protein [Paenibacillus aestuarii]|uniref:Uncharacterized protein n=1 Tax=Paenibacillus aestuarii TaxID=516965 RepID=A0ABW0K9H6_9BACL|nr:hypothetical protein [Paenibacillus aestuarii]
MKTSLSSDIGVLPVLSSHEYESFPPSFRGEVNGRLYLLYELPGMNKRVYDQVLVLG